LVFVIAILNSLLSSDSSTIARFNALMISIPKHNIRPSFFICYQSVATSKGPSLSMVVGLFHIDGASDTDTIQLLPPNMIFSASGISPLCTTKVSSGLIS